MTIRLDQLSGRSSTATNGAVIIPQLNNDPTPLSQTAWILHGGGLAGSAGYPIGILMAITDPGVSSADTYQLSYRTKENTTVRVTLS